MPEPPEARGLWTWFEQAPDSVAEASRQAGQKLNEELKWETD